MISTNCLRNSGVLFNPIKRFFSSGTGKINIDFKVRDFIKENPAIFTLNGGSKILKSFSDSTEKEYTEYLKGNSSRLSRNSKEEIIKYEYQLQGQSKFIYDGKSPDINMWSRQTPRTPQHVMEDKSKAVEDIYIDLLNSPDDNIQLLAIGSDNAIEVTVLSIELIKSGKNVEIVATEVNPLQLNVARIVNDQANQFLLSQGLSTISSSYYMHDIVSNDLEPLVSKGKTTIALPLRSGIILPKTTGKIIKSADKITTILLKDSQKTGKAFVEKYRAKIVSENEYSTVYQNPISQYIAFKSETGVEKFFNEMGGRVNSVETLEDTPDDHGTESSVFIVNAEKR